ncbi:MAG TPA: hypothetical protein VMT81_02820 [Candidatus Paceibacterota bacterium]|nr:hypothetical protein [Candidatus Paceibacterota bacterium]
MNRRGLAPIPVLLVITVVILVICVIWYYGVHQPGSVVLESPPTNTSATTVAASTTTWKTFIDDRYGFMLQYPADWYVNSSVGTGDPNDSFGSVPASAYYHGGILPSGEADITILRIASSLERTITSDFAGETIPMSLPVAVDGVSGSEFRTTVDLGSNATLQEVSLYLPYGGFTYKILFDYRDNPRWSDTFNEMLSTFQFAPVAAVSASNGNRAAIVLPGQ